MRDPDAFDRTHALARLAGTTFDVVVIGGGITGAGVALDAAARGLRTALVERDDFASGTSSKSSKMVHGGLRYLQQREIGLVYEALAERQRLRKNAPHLVKTLPFLFPMFSKDGLIPPKLARAMGTMMWMYDLTGGARIGKLHDRVSKAEALAHMPTLKADRLAASYLYYDARADDARLTLALARTAAIDHGAVVANRCRVVAVTKDADGRADTVRVDAGDHTIDVRTRSVVNATGVWADEIRSLDEDAHPSSIRPARGVHLTVPWDKVRCDIAVVLPVPKDKRSIFVVPWGNRVYIGTTDTDDDSSVDDPQCTPADVAYLLGAVNYWVQEPLTEDDVLGTWAGLRPLVRDAGSDRTADLSRRHAVLRSPSGVVTITGGKLTTYRQMAADTVDEILAVLGADVAGRVQRRCPTAHLRLRGADEYETVRQVRSPLLDPEQVGHLADRYGGEATTLLAMVERSPDLADPLVPGLPYLRVEALYGVRYEMATTIADVLDRRTRARLLGRDACAAAAPEVAALLAPELGWSETERDDAIERYRQDLEHERTAADLPHTLDQAAVAAATTSV
jgi:glycerol-3-phosphate dehydrogenase